MLVIVFWKFEKLWGRADSSLSFILWLLWLLHRNSMKRYAEEKPKRIKSNNKII
jgi:hypothetical protein